MAATIVEAQLHHGVLSREALFERNRALTEIANRDPHPTKRWRATAAVVRAYELYFAAANDQPGFDQRAALVEVDELVAVTTGLEPQATAFEAVRTGLRAMQMVQGGDFGTASEVGTEFRQILERMDTQGIGNPNFEVLRSLGSLIDRLDHHDVDAATALYDRFEQLLGMIPTGSTTTFAPSRWLQPRHCLPRSWQ